uniref:Sp140 nuclear body protein like 2 n=1 Tax=Mus musculus TaxID=10090 RepID=E0CXL1_MOUSE
MDEPHMSHTCLSPGSTALPLQMSWKKRTIPEDQNEEESDDYQLMFKHFKENKVEIASAITKPFPFLMSLRDRDFISEQKFQEYQETCKNLVPLERVVYDILSNVQKKFSRDLLKVIFSKTHLKAYPEIRNQVHQL